MSEIELQLRLDDEGRTAFDASRFLEQKGVTNVECDQSIEKKRKREQGCDGLMTVEGVEKEGSCHVNQAIDYSCKTVNTALSDNLENSKVGVSNLVNEETMKHEKIKLLDELLLDCEIADSALLPRTFWLPAKGRKPRCALEQCALEVFHHHVKPGFEYDEERSGCEWWVQIRPSPPAGRYAVLSNNQGPSSTQSTATNKTETPVHQEKETQANEKQSCKLADLEKNGICFHWDKDEELRLLMGGNMYIHPHISTVTYLTSIGAPTMALNYRVNPLTGEHISPPSHHTVDSFLSSPKLGKHLSFDGRYLHAAPYDLMEDGVLDRQLDPTDGLNGVAAGKDTNKVRRRHRRVTFLVNIWLNYKPLNVDLFPDSMLNKLTKPLDTHILFSSNNCTDSKSDREHCNVIDYCYDGSRVKTPSKPDTSDDLVFFQWPLGDGGSERVEMHIPLGCVRKQIGSAGDIRLRYGCDTETQRAVRLVKESRPDIKSSEGVLSYRDCSTK